MTRSLNRLTPTVVKKALTGQLEDGRHSDGGNLYLRVRRGAGNFVFMSSREGRRAELGLGSILTLGAEALSRDPMKISTKALEQARLKAATLHADIIGGATPKSFAKREGKRQKIVIETIQDILTHYLATKKITDKHKVKDRQRIVDSFAKMMDELTGSQSIKSISREVALAWRDERSKQISANSFNRELATLSGMFSQYIIDFEADFKNPLRKMRLALGHDEIGLRNPISKDQVKALRKHLASDPELDEVKDIFELLFYTGARQAEIAYLRWEDIGSIMNIDVIKIVPHAGRRLKNNASKRIIPIYKPITDILSKRRGNASENDVYVFPQVASKPATNLSKTLMNELRQVIEDQKITVHSTRHALIAFLRVNHIDQNIEDLYTGHQLNGTAIRTYADTDTRVVQMDLALKGIIPHYLKN